MIDTSYVAHMFNILIPQQDVCTSAQVTEISLEKYFAWTRISTRNLPTNLFLVEDNFLVWRHGSAIAFCFDDTMVVRRCITKLESLQFDLPVPVNIYQTTYHFCLLYLPTNQLFQKWLLAKMKTCTKQNKMQHFANNYNFEKLGWFLMQREEMSNSFNYT